MSCQPRDQWLNHLHPCRAKWDFRQRKMVVDRAWAIVLRCEVKRRILSFELSVAPSVRFAASAHDSTGALAHTSAGTTPLPHLRRQKTALQLSTDDNQTPRAHGAPKGRHQLQPTIHRRRSFHLCEFTTFEGVADCFLRPAGPRPNPNIRAGTTEQLPVRQDCARVVPGCLRGERSPPPLPQSAQGRPWRRHSM